MALQGIPVAKPRKVNRNDEYLGEEKPKRLPRTIFFQPVTSQSANEDFQTNRFTVNEKAFQKAATRITQNGSGVNDEGFNDSNNRFGSVVKAVPPPKPPRAKPRNKAEVIKPVIIISRPTSVVSAVNLVLTNEIPPPNETEDSDLENSWHFVSSSQFPLANQDSAVHSEVKENEVQSSAKEETLDNKEVTHNHQILKNVTNRLSEFQLQNLQSVKDNNTDCKALTENSQRLKSLSEGQLQQFYPRKPDTTGSFKAGKSGIGNSQIQKTCVPEVESQKGEQLTGQQSLKPKSNTKSGPFRRFINNFLTPGEKYEKLEKPMFYH